MIIQCPECQTRFRMADEKMKPGGTKVRCSRCRHIFLATGELPVTRPEPPPAEESVDFGDFNMKSVGDGEEIAASALGRAAGEESGASISFRPGSSGIRGKMVEEFISSTTVGGDEEVNAAAGEISFDMEMSASPPEPVEESPTAAAPPAADEIGRFSFGGEEPEAKSTEFSFGEEEENGSPGLSFGKDASSLEFSTGDDDNEDKSPEFSFGDDDQTAGTAAEFSFGEEEPDSAPGEFSFEVEDSETAQGRDDFSFDEPFATEDSFARTEETGLSFEEEKDENPLDLSRMTFGDPPPVAAPPSPPPAQTLPPGRAPVTERPKEFAPDEFPGPEASLSFPAPPARKSPFSRVLAMVLLLLLVLAGTAGYFFYRGGAPDLSQLAARLTGANGQASGAGQVRLTGLSGTFVQNREAGQLFVIRGVAINEYKESRSSIAVKGVLYNQQGQPLLQQTVFAGNSLDEEALRTLSYAKIEERMNNQFGDSLSNLNVSPGKTIPFVIVFKNLPTGLAEFTVEIADSKPGSG